MRVRIADVRVIRLENRRPFTGLVSSNLTLSAKIEKQLTSDLDNLGEGFARARGMDSLAPS